MTTFKAAQAATIGSSAYGTAVNLHGKATVTANLTTDDEVIALEIPAGTRLDRLRYRNEDLDTGTTLAANFGHRSKHPYPAQAANATAFLSASTALRAAQAGWQEIVFEPIVFNEPTQLVFKPTANGTGISGTPAIHVDAACSVLGVA